MPETMRAYLEAVQEQIRWKRARPVLIRELERHLADQRDAFLQEGKSPEEAERLAVRDMGDPVTVGTELDAVHRPRPQWGLLGLTIALAAAGAQIVLFTTGRGTPFGGFVPTLKIATNSDLAKNKANWIDFNAGAVLESDFETQLEKLIDLIVDTANGKLAKNEINETKEIAIFKTGVTL